jgi:hypothetical protein
MTFVIENGNHTTTIRGRMDAVRKARDLSAQTWRPIRVSSDEARVEMVFRNGELMTYGYDRRGRR